MSRIPESRYTTYGVSPGISKRKKFPNTTHITAVVSSGFRSVHHTPSVDRLYRTVRSRWTISLTSPRCAQRFETSEASGLRVVSES